MFKKAIETHEYLAYKIYQFIFKNGYFISNIGDQQCNN